MMDDLGIKGWLLNDSLPEFIHIPAGWFWMGSDALTDDEAPQHAVDLPDFWIGRFPVTVAQFQVFVDRSGLAVAPIGAVQALDNHPVVQVTWEEVLSYCQWLESELVEFSKTRNLAEVPWRELAAGRLMVSLPSEAEWEKAARGTDGRTYSWGEAFDARKANIDETGLGTTSAVGSFPSGASPYGVQDLVGNVWEWTRSLFGTWDEEQEVLIQKHVYPYDPNDGREKLTNFPGSLRVIRGASFAHDRTDTPCAYRGWDLPTARENFLGFRVAITQRGD